MRAGVPELEVFAALRFLSALQKCTTIAYVGTLDYSVVTEHRRGETRQKWAKIANSE
ncbi:MAG TPA: hypothetical protein VIV60_25900 [Polyangiaceae bacterium]